MLFNLNKCSYFELKLFSWQIRLFAFGHALANGVIFMSSVRYFDEFSAT